MTGKGLLINIYGVLPDCIVTRIVIIVNIIIYETFLILSTLPGGEKRNLMQSTYDEAL